MAYQENFFTMVNGNSEAMVPGWSSMVTKCDTFVESECINRIPKQFICWVKQLLNRASHSLSYFDGHSLSWEHAGTDSANCNHSIPVIQGTRKANNTCQLCKHTKLVPAWPNDSTVIKHTRVVGLYRVCSLLAMSVQRAVVVFDYGKVLPATLV
jgi:hypothetical protein